MGASKYRTCYGVSWGPDVLADQCYLERKDYYGLLLMTDPVHPTFRQPESYFARIWDSDRASDYDQYWSSRLAMVVDVSVD